MLLVLLVRWDPYYRLHRLSLLMLLDRFDLLVQWDQYYPLHRWILLMRWDLFVPSYQFDLLDL